MELMVAMKVNAGRLSDRTSIPIDQLLTRNNTLEAICVNAKQIFTEWGRLIRTARYSICIGVFEWEHNCDAVATIGANLVVLQQSLQQSSQRSSQRSTIQLRILVNNKRLFRSQIAEVRKSVLAWNLDSRLITVQLGVYGNSICHQFHHKVLVVDDIYVNVGGANPQRLQSFEGHWHDAAFTLRGECALIAQHDFNYYWNGSGIHWQCLGDPTQCQRTSPAQSTLKVPRSTASRGFTTIVLPQTSIGCFDEQLDSPLLFAVAHLFTHAQYLIKIQNPVMNSQIYVDLISQALSRNVRIWIILSIHWSDFTYNLIGGSNHTFIYNQLLPQLSTAQRSILQVKWFSVDGRTPTPRSGASSHVKFIGVDGRFSVIGSANYNKLSTRGTELNLLLDDVASTLAIEENVFDRDWELGCPIAI